MVCSQLISLGEAFQAWGTADYQMFISMSLHMSFPVVNSSDYILTPDQLHRISTKGEPSLSLSLGVVFCCSEFEWHHSHLPKQTKLRRKRSSAQLNCSQHVWWQHIPTIICNHSLTCPWQEIKTMKSGSLKCFGFNIAGRHAVWCSTYLEADLG